MPEPNVLYSVTAAVVLGLVAWVAVVLKSAKEPWTRDVTPPPAVEPAADAPLVSDGGSDSAEEKPVASESTDSKKPASAPPSSSLPKVEAGEASGPPDATAPATAVVLKKKTEDADEKADAEAKADADEKADGDEEADAEAKADAEATADAKKEA